MNQAEEKHIERSHTNFLDALTCEMRKFDKKKRCQLLRKSSVRDF